MVVSHADFAMHWEVLQSVHPVQAVDGAGAGAVLVSHAVVKSSLTLT